jgi:hypothetical protein
MPLGKLQSVETNLNFKTVFIKKLFFSLSKQPLSIKLFQMKHIAHIKVLEQVSSLTS